MTNTTQLLKLATAAVALAGVAAAGTGCDVAGKPDGRPADRFLGYGETSPVDRLVERQIAAGARTDGTLRPYHFDEATLNSLGQAKVDAMLKDFGASDGVLVVYVDVPRGEGDPAVAGLTDARRTAVSDYLLEQGVAEGSFKLESGYNPNVTTAVAAAKPAKEAAASEKAADAGFGQGLGDSMGSQQQK